MLPSPSLIWKPGLTPWVANVTPCFFPLSNYEAFAPFYVHRTAQAAISQLHFHALDTPAHLKHMQVSGFRVEGLRAKR